MSRRRKDTLKRKQPTRQYRSVCWISAEGQTERDYFTMDVFRGSSGMSIKFPEKIHPSRTNPSAVLKRFKKALAKCDFRKTDKAWIVVDVDTWNEAEFKELLDWAQSDSRFNIAISNPKFELFLIMHFENGNGCTTSERVDSVLKRYIAGYNKRLKSSQFDLETVCGAVEHAKQKRKSCKSNIPDPGMTDVHLLIEALLDQAKQDAKC